MCWLTWARVARNALEDPWVEPDESMFTRSLSPMAAPDEPTSLELHFEEGNPVGINGNRLQPATLLTALNTVRPLPCWLHVLPHGSSGLPLTCFGFAWGTSQAAAHATGNGQISARISARSE